MLELLIESYSKRISMEGLRDCLRLLPVKDTKLSSRSLLDIIIYDLVVEASNSTRLFLPIVFYFIIKMKPSRRCRPFSVLKTFEPMEFVYPMWACQTKSYQGLHCFPRNNALLQTKTGH